MLFFLNVFHFDIHSCMSLSRGFSRAKQDVVLANPLTSLTGTLKPQRAPQFCVCHWPFNLRNWDDGGKMGPRATIWDSPLHSPVLLWSICERLVVSDLEVAGFLFSKMSVIKHCLCWSDGSRADSSVRFLRLVTCVSAHCTRPALFNTAWLPLFTTTRTSSEPRGLNYVLC